MERRQPIQLRLPEIAMTATERKQWIRERLFTSQVCGVLICRQFAKERVYHGGVFLRSEVELGCEAFNFYDTWQSFDSTGETFDSP